jgi:putative intracellular protease/amidase
MVIPADPTPSMDRPPRSMRIGVLIEAHFDETEFRRFNEVFPARGYELVYLSHLWGQPELTFVGNDNGAQVTVQHEVNAEDPLAYDAILLIGGYAMDRLRYQEHPREGFPNTAPAVAFLRKAVAAMDAGAIHMGTICHSLWLFCAAPETLRGRRVTCAHNIMGDVAAAGGSLVYDGDQLAATVVDGNLITARHPGVTDAFLDVLLAELDRSRVPVGA